jgi:hypothetical protein
MIRVGTKGRIVNVDGDRRAEFYDGVRAKVLERRYFPDAVIVELLDAGPLWKAGYKGEIALRYFVPDKRGSSKHGSGKPQAHARMTKRTNDDEGPLTERDYQQAAKFDMKRFGLTLSEALTLVKDARYPGILKTIDDWRAKHGWPAATSALTRGYIYELLGLQRGHR